MNQTIIDAINQQKVLKLWWQGGERTVHPHAYGINTAGNPMLRCWQVDGWSRTSRVPAWKPVLVDRAHSFEIQDETFLTHHQYRRDDKHMMQIFAQI